MNSRAGTLRSPPSLETRFMLASSVSATAGMQAAM
jgi:hypothetical protein